MERTVWRAISLSSSVLTTSIFIGAFILLDLGDVPRDGCISSFVHDYPHMLQTLADRCTYGARVLAYAPGEDYGIQAAQDRDVGADIFLDPITEHPYGEPGALIPLPGLIEDLPHVAYPRDALEAA